MDRFRPAHVGDDRVDRKPGTGDRLLNLDSEYGSGVFGTVLGTGIFLILMLVSVQVLTHLYATSVVEAATYDAVQSVTAASGGDVATAEQQARSLMGSMGDEASFEWATDSDDVVLRVTVQRGLSGSMPFADMLGVNTIEREIRMRTEGFR